MLEVQIPDNQLVTVMVTQSTFAVLTLPGRSFRVDFLDKAEAWLKPGVRGKFISYSEHPLLLPYNSPKVSVYINSRPENPEALFSAIQAGIKSLLQGWRDWQSVLAWDISQFKKNLLDGSGILLQDAPVEVAKIVMDASTEQSALTWLPTPSTAARQRVNCFLLVTTTLLLVTSFSPRFSQKDPYYQVNQLDANEGDDNAAEAVDK